MIVRSPEAIPETGRAVFLAGSIEMGLAHNWQVDAEKKLSLAGLIVLNPRRDDWDKNWLPIRENPKFVEQVRWELDALERADFILMYFDPNTKSPISLLELGLFASSGKIIVVCPDGFWRKGNVDLVSERYNLRQVETLDMAIQNILDMNISEK